VLDLVLFGIHVLMTIIKVLLMILFQLSDVLGIKVVAITSNILFDLTFLVVVTLFLCFMNISRIISKHEICKTLKDE